MSNENLGKHLLPGSRHYRAFIGVPKLFDVFAAMQFNLLTFLGLREHHFLLDVGCGSLRAGKLFISYLQPEHYFGIEPEQWLIDEGIKNELGKDIVRIKRPRFSDDRDFTLSVFKRKFDYIIAHSIFTHATQQQITRCLSEAKTAMKPSTTFAATFIEGDKNYSGNKWVYPETVSYTMEHMLDLARENGLICKSICWPHPTNQTWILITLPGKKTKIPSYLSNANSKLYFLETQYNYLKKRYLQMMSHPYVRFGLKVQKAIRKIKLVFKR